MTVPNMVLSISSWTLKIPTGEVAVVATVIVALTVPPVGEVIETVGGMAFEAIPTVCCPPMECVSVSWEKHAKESSTTPMMANLFRIAVIIDPVRGRSR